MDLVKLDPQTYYIADNGMIEGYDSLIWTERYLDASDFQMVSYDVKRIKRLLPVGSFVSLRDTKETMIVESHAITQDDDGYDILTTKGRSVETFGEQRVVPGNSGLKVNFTRFYTTFGATEVLLYDAFVSTGDYYRSIGNNSFVRNPSDALPNVGISDNVHTGYEAKMRQFEAGYVYPYILDYLDEDDLGIRTLRPDSGSTAFITSISGVDGSISRDTRSGITKMLINIYDGEDRTAQQSDRPHVIFRSDLNQVDNPAYVFTLKQRKNAANWATNEVFGVTDRYRDLDDPVTIITRPGQITGWDRRVLFVDYQDKWTGRSVEVQSTNAREDTRDRLKKNRYRRKAWFDGQLTDRMIDRYGSTYFLGDKVTLRGAEYDVDETATVTEYIRTQDQNGENNYPTLVVADPPT